MLANIHAVLGIKIALLRDVLGENIPPPPPDHSWKTGTCFNVHVNMYVLIVYVHWQRYLALKNACIGMSITGPKMFNK